MKVPQYVKLMKDGKYEFCSDHPIDDGKIVAVFDCKHSEKPLHESVLYKKPTRTEYVKVESCDWNVWEYLKAYNDGEVDWFFKMDDGNYTKLVNWFDVANRLNAGKCEFYRRIEKEVDWHEVVISEMKKVGGVSGSSHYKGQLKIEGIFDKDQAITLAKSILSATS